MDATYIIVVLALVTMLGFIVFAMVSKKKTEERLHDSNAPKSTLAKDKASEGKPADT